MELKIENTYNKQKMEIVFHWIGGATFVLSIGKLNIACDPVLCEKGTIQDYFWFKSKRLDTNYLSYTIKIYFKIVKIL